MQDREKGKTRGKRTAGGKNKAKANAALPEIKATPKTKHQLLEELASLRQRLAELETVEADSQRIIRAYWEKEEILAKFMNACPDAFVLFDSNMNYIIFNKAAEELTGITLEQAAGKNVTEFVPDIKKSGRYDKYMEVIRTGKPFYSDDLMPHSIFGDKHLAVRAFKVGDGLGFIATDITERHKMWQELQKKEAEYKGLAESITDVFFAMDKDLKYTHWNKASEKLTGIMAEDALGKHLGELFPDTEMTKRAEKMYRQALETKQPQHFINEFPLQGRNYVFEISAYPANNGLSVFVKDITERTQLEKALQEAYTELSAIYAGAPIAMIMVDRERRVTKANGAAAKFAKRSVEEMLGLRGGEALRCLNSLDDPRGCGFGPNCDQCVVRLTVIDTFETGNRHTEVEATLPFERNGKREERHLLISTSLIGFDTTVRVLVCAQDITEHKQAEHELKESEAKYRSLSESSQAGICIIQDGKYVYVNNRFAQMHGYTVEEVLGMGYLDLVHPDYREITVTRVADRLKGQYDPAELFAKKRLKKDGQTFWGEMMSTTIDYHGKPAIMANIIDITQRKLAEETLVDEATRRRILIEQSRDGIVILDQDGQVYEANQKFADMLGYPLEAMRQLKVYDWEFLYPPERVVEMIRSVDEKGDHFETKHRRRDGSIYDVEISTNAAWFAGQKLIFCVCRDITQRKQAEEQLKASEERYRILIENAAEGIVVTQDGAVKFLNNRMAEITGYAAEEITSKPFTEFIHPDDRAMIAERYPKRLGKEDVPPTYSFRMIDGTGNIKWLQVSGTSITWESRPATLNFFVDITERKRLEEEKEVMEQKAHVTSRLALVGEMAAGIAHEINNPLTGIIGYAELLASREDLPEDVKKDLATIDHGAKRVADIVKRLLTFARQTKPSRDYVSIHELIRNTLELRDYQLRTGNITVTTEFDSDLPATVADAGQLQQVFLNIIANAETEMKLAHGRGNLLIKTRKIDNHILISFTDDGPGISKENLDKIFDPFFTTREVGKGTGLGLSICYGIIAEHGGRIWAESQPGKGATFFVELPIITEMAKAKDVEPVAEIGQIKGARILVVDDEEVIREFLSRVLTKEGHHVETVDNAAEALEKIQSGRYRLILLDIKMPGMSGMELYQRLKQIARSLADRVMFVTGDVMGADTEKFLEETGAPHITKPFDATRLKAELRRLLG